MNLRRNKYLKSAEPFFKKLKKKILKDPKLRIVYEENKAKTQLAMAVFHARKKAHLTQGELAEKVGTTQSVIARVESGTDKKQTSLPLLNRILNACGKELRLEVVPKHRHSNSGSLPIGAL